MDLAEVTHLSNIKYKSAYQITTIIAKIGVFIFYLVSWRVQRQTPLSKPAATNSDPDPLEWKTFQARPSPKSLVSFNLNEKKMHFIWTWLCFFKAYLNVCQSQTLIVSSSEQEMMTFKSGSKQTLSTLWLCPSKVATHFWSNKFQIFKVLSSDPETIHFSPMKSKELTPFSWPSRLIIGPSLDSKFQTWTKGTWVYESCKHVIPTLTVL